MVDFNALKRSACALRLGVRGEFRAEGEDGVGGDGVDVVGRLGADGEAVDEGAEGGEDGHFVTRPEAGELESLAGWAVQADGGVEMAGEDVAVA